MKSKMLQWLAIILILEIGLIHFFSAQHEYEHAAFLGYLFMANFLGALLAAYGIYRKQAWGWGLAFFIAAGALVGYIWSRTTGLPDLEAEAWLAPWGLVSLVSESLFILLFFLRPWRASASSAPQSSTPWMARYLLPAAGVIMLVLINGLAYRWDSAVGDLGHEHIVSLRELTRQAPMSSAEFEQQYGMRVTQIAISALDSIVDVRVKVVDPDKADALLDDHAALMVDEKSLVLAPHMHTHAKLKPGQIYVLFFPTQNRTVHTGSEVSLVFGDVRVESVIAR
jgi:hypothetical protein